MGITSNDLTAVNATSASNDARYGSGLALPKTPQANTQKVEGTPPAPAATPPSTDRILINELEGANEEIRIVARQIREVDHTLDAIAQNLEKMTASLESIVKKYPPYLQNDNERVAALRQFGGLRKLIDQLTVPSPDDSPAIILGDKKQFPEAGDWKFSAGNGSPLIIRHQPVHSGADGLDLPELATDAPDESVQMALGRMPQAQEALRQKRLAFAVDANRAIATLI